MRRERFGIVLLMSAAAVFVGAKGCNGDKPAPASQPEAAAVDIATDIVSGCVYGAEVVKVVITLSVVDKKCHADLTPASVCVRRGGVIRWKVENGCGRLVGTDTAPALQITVPTFKATLSSVSESLKSQAAGPSESSRNQASPPRPAKLESCALKAPSVEDRSQPGNLLLFCEVDNNAPHGFYKYGLTGQIDPPLDPDVEVRPGK